MVDACRRRSGNFLKQLKKSKRRVVLTVNGKAQAIVQDAEGYQRLLDIAAPWTVAGEKWDGGVESISARSGFCIMLGALKCALCGLRIERLAGEQEARSEFSAHGVAKTKAAEIGTNWPRK